MEFHFKTKVFRILFSLIATIIEKIFVLNFNGVEETLLLDNVM